MQYLHSAVMQEGQELFESVGIQVGEARTDKNVAEQD
jgi:hypothetical protein